MDFTQICVLSLAFPLIAAAQTAPIEAPPQTINAARNTPVRSTAGIVRLRGIVTAFSGWKNSFFLQDGAGAISVDRAENTSVEVGDDVEVTGHVQAGLFANIFVSEKAQVLARRTLPKPTHSTINELQDGDYDSRFVAITGVVHSVRRAQMWGRQMLFLDVKGGGSTITVYLPKDPGGDFQYLVDSEVRIEGVCGTIFNDHRQLNGLRLFVPGIRHIELLAPGRNPLSIPVSPLDSLLTFHGPALNHRVHIRGTETYDAPGREIILQQGRSAVRIQGRRDRAWKTGTEIEAWGFVTSHGYLPSLENASLREVGRAELPPPLELQASQVFKHEDGFLQAPYDGLLVQMEATIVDRVPNSGPTIWAMEDQGVRFETQIANDPRGWALGFESGTRVKLTGICIAEIDETNQVNSFHILLRSPSDLAVIAPPYWNQSLIVLSVTYLALLIAGLTTYIFLQKKFPDITFNGSQSNSPAEVVCRRISQMLAALALFVALEISWTTPHGAPALLAASIAILLDHRVKSQINQLVRLFCISLIILKGTGAIVEGSTGWQWLHFAAMPLSIAVSLLVLGCSCVTGEFKRFIGFGQMLSVAVGVTALLRLVGALYGGSGSGLAAHLYMSVPSALALLALSIASLLSRPESGLMHTICSPRLGGMMLRRLIPAVVVAPILMGWLRLQLQVSGLIDTRFGLTLFALSNVVCFCFLLWTTAAILNRLDRLKSKTEETLREREEKLELIFATGSMGDWVWNIEPDSLEAHPSIWKLYGEPDKRGSEPAGWFLARQHPEDQTWLAEEVGKAQSARRPLDCEFRVIWPDASVHWIYCRAVPIFDTSDKLVQMSGINLDITNRKLAEAQLKQSEELFRKLQDAMPQIVWTANPNGEVIHYNRRWYDYTGLESPGDGWNSVVSEEELGPILEKWSTSVASGAPYENKIKLRRASDGVYRWHLARAVPVYDADGTLQRWFGTCTDIDDFTRASEELYTLNQNLEHRVEMRSRELAKAERKFRLLVESVRDYAIYMLDADGRVTSWNEGAERLKGYTTSEIVGRHFSIFFMTKDINEGEPERLLLRAAVEGNVSQEAKRVRKDGSQFWASVVINAVYDDAGNVCGFSKVVRDVTDRRRAEQLLIASRRQAEEANHAKSRFLAAMSHEIRTPMNAILGMADLLWDTVLDRVQREYVARFRRAGANLLTLINDILDLSKIESGRFELEAVDFDLLELIDRVIEIASPAALLKGISIKTQIAPGTPSLLVGDPIRLQQILNNLISNAVKFTPSGKVFLDIKSHADERQGHLEFAVSDTGIGIPPDKLATIFDDFIQAEASTNRRFGGTGLGLGICRRLVDKMNGTMTVQSVLNQGSTFRFDAVFSVGTHLIGSVPKELSDLAGRYVLVVDDSATNRLIICEMCAAWGLKTRSAGSAAEAVRLMKESHATCDGFALVLLDRVLPDTKDFDTLREIKCIDPNIPVVISSSDQQFGDLTEAKALGAAAYLMKPVRRTELRSCIFEALSTAATGVSANSADNQGQDAYQISRILLAEDSEDNRFLVQAYFAGKPYELTHAEDGQQAVDAFLTGKFDVILMDIQMPVMDGLTATKQIRAIEKERLQSPTVIIALTANALLEDSERSLQAGCNGHLPKPISKDKLVAAIEAYRCRTNSHEIPIEVKDRGEKFIFRIPPGFETISRKYIRKQLDGIAQLRLSLASNSMDELRHVGHQMKGTGTSYGFEDLTALGAAIEDAAKASDLRQLEIQVLEVEQYVKLAVETLG